MERWYGLTTALGRAALRGLDITTRVRGEQHLPATGPALLASVHVAYPDFLFIAKAGLQRGRQVRFLCRHDIWRVPVVRRGMDAMRHVPVDRQAPAAAYLRVRSLLADGEVVCAFPEAGSPTPTRSALMPGVAALSRETGVPILPVVVWGSQRIASVGRPVDGKGRPRTSPAAGPSTSGRAAAPGRTGRGRDARDPAARRDPHRDAGGRAAAARAPAEDGEYAPWYPAHLGGHAPDRREALLYDVVRARRSPPRGPPIEGCRARLEDGQPSETPAGRGVRRDHPRDRILLSRLSAAVTKEELWTLPGVASTTARIPATRWSARCTRRPACTRRWVSSRGPRPPAGRLAAGPPVDAHALRIVYDGWVPLDSPEPRVVEVDGSTAEAAWQPVSHVLDGRCPRRRSCWRRWPTTCRTASSGSRRTR